MSKPARAEAKIHGETKKPKQFLLTESASQKLDQMAASVSMTRSEFLERLIRVADINITEKVKNYTPSEE